MIDRMAGLEGFGGVHLELEQGLVFSVTPHEVKQARTILRELPPDGPWALREIRWNLRELRRDQEAADGAAAGLAEAGIELTATVIDERENRLTVHVEGDRELAKEILDELLATDFSVGRPIRWSTLPGTID